MAFEAFKEGAAKGYEIAQLSILNNSGFFHVKAHIPGSDMGLLGKSLEGFNKAAPEGNNEGGSAHLGKMIFACDSDKLIFICHVPKEQQRKVDINKWMEVILQETGGKPVASSVEGIKKGEVTATHDSKKRTTVQIRDDAIHKGYAWLKSLNLVYEDDDEDEGDEEEEFPEYEEAKLDPLVEEENMKQRAMMMMMMLSNRKRGSVNRADFALEEGGRKGRDIALVAKLGGATFFHVSLEAPRGEMLLLQRALEAFNKDPHPNDKAHLGGAKDLAKFLFSYDKERLIFLLHVPEALRQKSQIDVKKWFDVIVQVTEGHVLSSDANTWVTTGEAIARRGLTPATLQDKAIKAGYEWLKSLGTIFREDDLDDGFGDDDFPEYYGEAEYQALEVLAAQTNKQTHKQTDEERSSTSRTSNTLSPPLSAMARARKVSDFDEMLSLFESGAVFERVTSQHDVSSSQELRSSFFEDFKSIRIYTDINLKKLLDDGIDQDKLVQGQIASLTSRAFFVTLTDGPCSTIEAIKSMIQLNHGYAVDKQTLVCRGQTLENSSTLSSLGLTHTDTLLLWFERNQESEPESKGATKRNLPGKWRRKESIAKMATQNATPPQSIRANTGPEDTRNGRSGRKNSEISREQRRKDQLDALRKRGIVF